MLRVLTSVATCSAPASLRVGVVARGLHALITGPPAAGKGTISERIIRDFPLKHISSGQALRDQVAAGTEVGKLAKAYMAKGELIPDDVVLKLMVAELANISGNWLLDGFPRTAKQAEELDKLTKIDVCISLDVPESVLIARATARWTHPGSGRVYSLDFNPPKVAGKDDVTGEPLIQREDDKEETVRNRLSKYHALTKPLLAYYEKQGKLVSFTGETSNIIYPQVQKYLASLNLK